MSKICILTGSPRNGGNSFIMTEAFEAAVKEKGHEVKRYDTGMMNIKGCIGCTTCYSNGFPCNSIRDDDFNAMAPDILEADILVFAMPVYWYSFPAQFKAALDRMFCFCVGKQLISGKKYILISCCEEKDETVMDGIKLPLERGAKLLGWEKIGELLVPGVYEKGDVNNTDAVEQAAKLADLCD